MRLCYVDNSLRLISALAILMFAISHSTDAIAKSPGFPKSKVEEVKTLTRKAGV